ncbi:MAG: ABC transporter ATP-binding protein, partial [Arcobacteraceae bacterium]|nr:ABC transporter ATP-binding protein [Arcobacteraceae bacterium]
MEKLEVKGLNHHFGFTEILKDINFTLEQGQVLSVVGPSGGGKTTLLHLCADLLDVEEGSVENSFVSSSFAFQEGRLLPWKNVIDNISLGLLAKGWDKNVATKMSEDIALKFGLEEEDFDKFPKDLSGGMRQRVMIAMGLSCNPSLLIADEPTTALDVTIQAQILDLMKELKEKYKTSILLITHDLAIIAEMCDRVAVMYSGNIVEYATAEDLFKNPRHPYTQGLIGAIPSIEKKNQELQTIRGMVPNLIFPPSGCRFHPRCNYRMEI